MSSELVIGLAVQILTFLAALMAFIRSTRNSEAIHEVHLSLNSRLTELLNSTKEAAHAAGRSAAEASHTAGKAAEASQIAAGLAEQIITKKVNGNE